MSRTEHDDAVGADPSLSHAEALGTCGAEPSPRQVRPMAGPTLIARSRQGVWQLFVLVPALALLVWMTAQAWSPSFHAEGRIAYLNDVPGGVRAAFFLSCALICIGCIGIVLWRRLWPRVELIVDDHSVTSKLFWGPGTLPWSAVTHLTRQNNWLFVHGTSPDGRRRRLIVNLLQLDQEPSAILAAIQARRRDLG
jgi:hypothetical protein